MVTALIVEDEPLLAAELREELKVLWPELTSVDSVHDGVAALRKIEAHRPDVLFLDVQMPGLSGIEVARIAGARSHVVFITAFDHYAVEAFEQGAVDYLLKPIDTARLAQALGRVRLRLQQPPADMSALFEKLQRGGDRLQWIMVPQGRDIQLIAVDDVCYFRADNKCIEVVTAAGESLITTPLRDLMGRLDPTVFWQVSRGVVVNMHTVQSVRRSLTGQLDLKLKGRPETLRVSTGYSHLFKRMS